MESNRQIVIAELPRGPLRETHFTLREAAAPEPEQAPTGRLRPALPPSEAD